MEQRSTTQRRRPFPPPGASRLGQARAATPAVRSSAPSAIIEGELPQTPPPPPSPPVLQPTGSSGAAAGCGGGRISFVADCGRGGDEHGMAAEDGGGGGGVRWGDSEPEAEAEEVEEEEPHSGVCYVVTEQDAPQPPPPPPPHPPPPSPPPAPAPTAHEGEGAISAKSAGKRRRTCSASERGSQHAAAGRPDVEALAEAAAEPRTHVGGGLGGRGELVEGGEMERLVGGGGGEGSGSGDGGGGATDVIIDLTRDSDVIDLTGDSD